MAYVGDKPEYKIDFIVENKTKKFNNLFSAGAKELIPSLDLTIRSVSSEGYNYVAYTDDLTDFLQLGMLLSGCYSTFDKRVNAFIKKRV